MKVVDVRFVKERDSKKLEQQQEVMDKLTVVLAERIEERYEDVRVRVRYSSAAGLDISGFRGEEKEEFLEFFQEIWEDPFLLE